MVRKATIKDAETIILFNANLAKESEGLELDTTKLIDGVYTVLSDKTKGSYYVFEEDGKVVGQLMLTFEWSDWRNATFLWIQSVYVHKEYRRKKIFQALYNHIREIAANDPGICGIRLYVEKENKVAQTTYKKLGMNENHYLFYEWKK